MSAPDPLGVNGRNDNDALLTLGHRQSQPMTNPVVLCSSVRRPYRRHWESQPYWTKCRLIFSLRRRSDIFA